MKIKWNWGTGIFIAIILFMGFIIMLVVVSMQQNFDLVEKDYYPKALEYQQQIDKEQNAKKLEQEVKVENLGEILLLSFQSFFNPIDISGNLTFYRPSDKRGDKILEIKPDSSGKQYINIQNLQKGKYLLQIDYQVKGMAYYQEQPVFIKMY